MAVIHEAGKARIVTNLRGALALMRFDVSGLAQLESSWAGAQFSFIAALLAFPTYLFLQGVGEVPLTLSGMVVSPSIYALQWCLLPLATYYLCLSWGKLAAYPCFLASLNWMAVWQSLLYAVVLTGLAAGLLPEALMTTLSLALLIYLFAVEGFIAAAALGINAVGAAGIVILDLFFVWQLGRIRDYLLGL